MGPALVPVLGASVAEAAVAETEVEAEVEAEAEAADGLVKVPRGTSGQWLSERASLLP